MREDRHDREDREGHRRRHRHGLGSAIVGIGLLALGAALTLDNLDLVDASRILPYWPVLLILLGVSHVLQPAAARRPLAATIWVGVGTVLLLDNLDLVHVHVWDLWPLILVLVGGHLLYGYLRGRRTVVAESADSVSAVAVLGGVTRRITAAEFAGGSATAFMGGCEIDLTGSAPAGPPAEITAFAMWGGVEIKVPEDWEVRVEGSAILGGFEDNTHPTGEAGARKVLVVRGLAIMGGVEVKN